MGAYETPRLLLAASAGAGWLAGGVARATQAPRARGGGGRRVRALDGSATPGCAVGVGVNGTSVLERGYGMADLEHDVANTADTIFEAGSVSKQFTAAAVLLLAREGKLSLDDPVRKYIPELPDYGVPLTIRHMLTHTSGLRDWGAVAGIAGWPRGQRVYTHAHVLDIVSRQKALNFTPGNELVLQQHRLQPVRDHRVAASAGSPFADFSRDRIFKPLGMTHTSWRDDYTRIVKHRAIAYEPEADGFHEDMPFENVHGNGGLLTTVGDLLRWNENFVAPKVGRRGVRRRAADGGPFHRRPRARLRARAVRRRLPRRRRSESQRFDGGVSRVPDAVSGSASVGRRALQRGQRERDAVRACGGRGVPGVRAQARLPAARGDPSGPACRRPASRRRSWPAYTGRYASDEAETEFVVAVDGGELVLKRRPDTTLRMRPTGPDAFAVPSLGTITFRRAGGKVNALSVKLDRVWDLSFERK